MSHRKKEFLVGCLVVGVGVLLASFAWLMGVFNPFSRGITVNVVYDFAGGIEVGSAVRVAGIKVGKVDAIDFISHPTQLEKKTSSKENALLGAIKVTLSISDNAAVAVREDSRFYINLAGIIGERYVEVTPGSEMSPRLVNGATIRGTDPPRIDQLLSQGYSVFGKVLDFLNSNEENLETFLAQLKTFMEEANTLLARKDWKNLSTLLKNLGEMSGEIRILTKKIKDPEAQIVLERLYELIERAHKVDKETLKEFLQEEGIRARIF